MTITSIDHLVLTVADVEATVSFYTRVLGFQAITFGPGRRALGFGRQKINLHPATAPISPHARHPSAGSADLCFLSETPIATVLAELAALGITVEDGPVPRTGATSPIVSIYFRDPDGNLIEVSNLVD